MWIRVGTGSTIGEGGQSTEYSLASSRTYPGLVTCILLPGYGGRNVADFENRALSVHFRNFASCATLSLSRNALTSLERVQILVQNR